MRRLVAFGLFAIAAPAHAGPCIPLGLAPDVLTPAGAKIARSGGVLVGTKQVPQGPRTDASMQPDWRFALAGGYAEPKRTTLAPGLTRYALPAGAAAATLEDARGWVRVTATKKLEIAPQAYRSEPQVPDRRERFGGDTRQFAWVDTSGRVSAKSSVITVKQ